jgi:hypothetical protein
MVRWRKIAAAAVCILGSQSLAAQAQEIEWSGTWTLRTGQCPTGIAIAVVERPGLLRYHSDGKVLGSVQPINHEATLEADGSGKIAFTTVAFGPMTVEIPAGRGKRALLLSQVQAQPGSIPCQWIIPD